VPQWQQPQWQPPVAWQPPPNWDPGVGSQPEQIVPFTAPPAKLKPWAIVTVIVAGLLLMVGGYVVVVVRVIDRAQEVALDDDRYTAPDPWVSEPVLSPSPSPSEATPEETVPSGPRASTYPVREDDDLNRVCDGWYYPQSPKFAGKAPHQISVGVIDSTALPSRNIMSSVSVPDLRESIWRAWMPTDPTKTQLVGCVDLVKTGGTLKSCKFDDPKPEKIAMKRATYRVRLYETATGKKLVDKAAVTGEDEDCPSLVFLMGNEPILSKVGDRQLYEFFRPYVMKK
jgi:hypothetical protein